LPMPRNPSSRRYLLTLNNPETHGYTHDCVRNLLGEFPGCIYWCMCDEIGEQGTPHTHVYVVFRNSVMFETLQKKFYGGHIDPASGNNQQNRDYVRKTGKWQEDAKHETNLPETFEEWGELPPDRTRQETQAERIMQMVRDRKSNAEILAEMPSAYNKLHHIEKARQTILEEQFKDTRRTLEVTYIWGETGTGKTRSVMDTYGYSNVFQVTDYQHPFDSYKGQDIILFEEFRSSLRIDDMLKYLDCYPCELPCRYGNKVACYTKVFFCSNIPFEAQYPNVQINEPATWAAFKRRIPTVIHMEKDYPVLEDDPTFNPDAIFGTKEVAANV